MIHINPPAGLHKSPPLEDIPSGTTFYGRLHSGRHLFLKAWQRVVDLADPETTYSDGDLTFDDYEVVEVDLTVRS